MASRAVRYLIRSVVGFVVVAGLATIGLWSWHVKVLQAPGPHSNDVFVVVESGDGHATIRWQLKRVGVITEHHFTMIWPNSLLVTAICQKRVNILFHLGPVLPTRWRLFIRAKAISDASPLLRE